mmetsp:Transcript_29106/g.90721  ORF Transcript_29106/g.90721 Transcript_29106/m.90721 type:complete len:248 (+) Transcript_29106:245-988(+)
MAHGARGGHLEDLGEDPRHGVVEPSLREDTAKVGIVPRALPAAGRGRQPAAERRSTAVQGLHDDVQLVLSAGLPRVSDEAHAGGVPGFTRGGVPEVVEAAGRGGGNTLQAPDGPGGRHLLPNEDSARAAVAVTPRVVLGVPDAAGPAAAVDAGGATRPYVADALLVVAATTTTTAGAQVCSRAGLQDLLQRLGLRSRLANRRSFSVALARLLVRAPAQSRALDLQGIEAASRAVPRISEAFVVPGQR